MAVVAAVVLGVCALVLGLVLRMEGSEETPGSSTVFAAVPTTATPVACAAPVGLPYQDRYLKSFNGRDADQLPPMRRSDATGPVRVKYINENLGADAWREMERAMAVWNASPCVQLTTALECAAGENCVRVNTSDLAFMAGDVQQAGGSYNPDDSINGEYSTGGRLEMEKTMMDDLPSVYLVAVHEMGHSLGLDHRSERSTSVMSVMNSPTGNPDRIDFDNLRVLYGR